MSGFFRPTMRDEQRMRRFMSVGSSGVLLGRVILPGVHRYWRVNVTANNGNTSFGAGADEIWLAETVGGPNIATGGTATASSIINGSNTAAMAFSGSFGDRWLSAAGSPQYIYYDFGAGNEKQILQVRIAGPQSALTASPKDFTFDYGDNTTVWTPALTQTGVTGWATATYKDFNV